METGFFLLAGHGLLGLRLGYGRLPAVFMWPMLAAFSLALSLAHARMRAAIHPRGDREATRRNETDKRIES